MGRPTKCDEHTAEVIAKAVAIGMPYKLAAQLAGIDVRTLYGWKAKGKAGEEAYVQFFQVLRANKVKAMEHALRAINSAAERGEWKAAAWLLERRFPDEFGTERRRVRELAAMLEELKQKIDRVH